MNDKNDTNDANQSTGKTRDNNKDNMPPGGDNQVNIKTGDRNEGNVIAGRDIITIYNQHKAEFFTPGIEVYDDSNYTGPKETPVLVKRVLKERFLFLGGSGYEKKSLARHIAGEICKKKEGDSPNVKEWAGSAKPQNFDRHFIKKDERLIFLLPGLAPLNVDYDLEKLYTLARKNEHFLIVTTDLPLEVWKFSKELKCLCWAPKASDTLYEADSLVNILSKELIKAGDALPEVFHGEDFKNSETTLGNITLKDAAVRLKAPESIEKFVVFLTSLENSVKKPDVVELIDICQNDRVAVPRWYYGFLKPHEQLIALGLCLFDGLYDDQFFAAMEALVKASWNNREKALLGLDYCDLERLGDYYTLNGSGLKRVESISGDLRGKILKTVWGSHRRQIASALPVLEEFVKKSTSINLWQRELYGSEERCRRLRDVVSETLCRIGLVNVDFVENSLLSLAAQEDERIQVVVADAMARWRAHGCHEQLFDILQRWQNNPPIRQIVESIMENKGISGMFYIKATMAITVGFAAHYDPPNKLNDKLYDLLEQLAKDSDNWFLFIRFAVYTLPQVVRLHLRQLEDLLWRMTRHAWLNEAIGLSLAVAYRENPEDVANILDQWYRKCNADQSNQTNRRVISQPSERDKQMATVVYAYGWINYSEEKKYKETISTHSAYQKLMKILRDEASRYVREAAVNAIMRQTDLNFKEVEKHIRPLFEKMHDPEKNRIINALVDIFLKQRQELKDGDGSFEIKIGDKEAEYWVWCRKRRPLTTVEEVSRKWLKDGKNDAAQQIAYRFEAAPKKVAFEKQEEKFISQLKEKQKMPDEDDIEKRTPVFHNVGFNIVTWFLSWLVAFKDRTSRRILRGLLPEALKQKKTDDEIFKHVLNKWSADPDGQMRRAAKKMERAAFIASNKKNIGIAAAFLFVLLLFLAVV
ncbi:MAG: hypothetical protein GY757_60185 [bacterium]|nr:hypothetical protein [bacterium]